jgi:hypothetical protein
MKVNYLVHEQTFVCAWTPVTHAKQHTIALSCASTYALHGNECL